MNATRHVRRQQRTRPALEGLEERELMAGGILQGVTAIPLINSILAHAQPVAVATVLTAPRGVTAAGVTAQSSQATILRLTVSDKAPKAGSKVTFTATLTTSDTTHKALAGETVKFTYNGTPVMLTTNSKGQVRKELTAVKKGYANIVVVDFVGSKPYNASHDSMQVVSK
jgi:hypothetical protein